MVQKPCQWKKSRMNKGLGNRAAAAEEAEKAVAAAMPGKFFLLRPAGQASVNHSCTSFPGGDGAAECLAPDGARGVLFCVLSCRLRARLTQAER